MFCIPEEVAECAQQGVVAIRSWVGHEPRNFHGRTCHVRIWEFLRRVPFTWNFLAWSMERTGRNPVERDPPPPKKMQCWSFLWSSSGPKSWVALCPKTMFRGCFNNTFVVCQESVLFKIVLGSCGAFHLVTHYTCFSAENVPYHGPLNRLNAIVSLLQPLDSDRAPSAIESAIGGALSRPISNPHTGGSSQPPCPKPLRGLNRAIVVLQCLKPL